MRKYSLIPILLIILISGCVQQAEKNNISNQPTAEPTETPQATVVPTPVINETQLDFFNETDYPEITARIENAKSEINRAILIVTVRTSSVPLNNCDSNACPLNDLQISQDNAHLDCNGKTITPESNEKTAITITSDNVSIVNCHIESFNSAIIVTGSGAMIFGNTIMNNSKGGIIVKGNNNKVFSSNFRDNKWAHIDVKAGSRGNIIYNNTMIDTEGRYQPYTNSFAAIGLSGLNNTVLENVIKNNVEIGIKMAVFSPDGLPPSRNLIARNVIENSGVLGLEIAGAAVGESGSADLNPVSDGRNIIFNNSFSQSKLEFGLRIRWSNNNKIIGNLIHGNNWQGIHIMSSNGTLIEKNTIFRNGQGGIWLGNSHKNEISFNIISDNLQHCGILFTDWSNIVSTKNAAKNNMLSGNENRHDDKQICDEDNNEISQNKFE